MNIKFNDKIILDKIGQKWYLLVSNIIKEHTDVRGYLTTEKTAYSTS